MILLCVMYSAYVVSIWFEAKVLLVSFVALLHTHEMAMITLILLHAYGFTNVYRNFQVGCLQINKIQNSHDRNSQ